MHYACLLIWVIICMKVYEDILSGFKLYNGHDSITKSTIFSLKGLNSKNRESSAVMVLVFCMS